MKMRAPTNVAFWVVMVLLYSWPALWNGGPFFFPDSSHYIRSADAAVVSLTGTKSEWSDRIIFAEDKPSELLGHNESNSKSTSIRSTQTVLTGRSIYYGATVYFGLMAGTLGPVFIQSAIAVTAIGLFLFGAARGVDPQHRRRWVWGGLLAVGILTPLPFFISRLMPDAFTGLLAVALVALLVFWDSYTKGSRLILILIASAAVLFHTSHILLCIAIGAAALILNIGAKPSWRRLIVLPLGLTVIAAAGQMIFSVGVERTLNTSPISPPFMSARLIDDGPGYRYLKEHCDTDTFMLCRYLDRMPNGSDTLLWSKDPREGIFSAVPDPVKRALGKQDIAFYITVLKDRPTEVLSSMLRSTGKQSVAFHLDHFNYIAAHREGYLLHLPNEIFRSVGRSPAFRGNVPVYTMEALTIAVTLVSLLVIGAAVISAVRRGVWRLPAVTAAMVLVLAVAANIVICGALSTPHGRYLMRIIWLLPLAVAALGASEFQFRHSRRIPTGAMV